MAEKEVKILIKVGVVGAAEKDALIKNLEKLGGTVSKTNQKTEKLGSIASKTSKKTTSSLKTITPTMESLWQQADKLSKHWGVSFQTALPYVKKLGDGFKYVTTDTYKLAQAAQQVSQKFKISFDGTYATLKKMGVGFKGVSVDIDKTAKAARKFADAWGVSFKKAFEFQLKNASEVEKLTVKIGNSFKKIPKALDTSSVAIGKRAKTLAKEWGISIEQAIVVQKNLVKEVKSGRVAIQSSLNKTSNGMKKTEGQIKSSSKNIGHHLTFIAWHFRYLGNIFDQVYKAMIKGVKDVIRVTSELEESFLSIRTAAAMFGRDAEKASGFARELALTGLMPLQEAAGSVKDLMITGLGLPELEKFTYRYLDVAFLFTSGSDEMAKSLETVSRAILKGTMQLSTDKTAKVLWLETEQRLQKTRGLGMNQITAQQRALEILTTIEKKWGATQDFHQIEMDTTRAAMTKLNNSILIIKDSIGKALLPLLNALVLIFGRVTIYVQAFIDVLGPVVPVVVAVALAVTFLIAKLSFLIGVYISVIKIAGMTAAMLWKIYLPVMAIGAVLGVGTYLLLKYTGALDKAKNSAKNITDALDKVREKMNALTETQEEAMIVDDSRRIAHERTVEDIEEDLERERSKGLWANQMAIKDLEKRLKRENEDWDRHLKELGDKDVADPSADLGGIFGGLLDDANETVEELGKMNWFEKIFEDLKDLAKWAMVGAIILNSIKEIFNKTINIVKEIFSDTVYEEWAKNWFNLIISASDIIKAAFEGLFGSIMKGIGTIAALTFVAAFGLAIKSSFATGGVGLTSMASSATILGAGFMTALKAAIVPVIIITAVFKTAEVLIEIRNLNDDLDALNDSVQSMSEKNAEYLNMIAKKFGKNSDEYKKATASIVRDTENVSGAIDDTVIAIEKLINIVKIISALAIIAVLAKWAVGFWGVNTAIGFAAGSATGLGTIIASIAAALIAPFTLTVAVLGGAAVAGILYQVNNLKGALDGMNNSISNLSTKQSEYLTMIKNKYGRQSAQYREATKMMSEDSKKVSEAAKKASDALTLGGMGRTTLDWIKDKIPSRQTGGIVPGMLNEAVPIIAHGGERVIPAGEVGSGGNITVNINNPNVRNQEDINSIARAVSNVLGQRANWSRMGSF